MRTPLCRLLHFAQASFSARVGSTPLAEWRQLPSAQSTTPESCQLLWVCGVLDGRPGLLGCMAHSRLSVCTTGSESHVLAVNGPQHSGGLLPGGIIGNCVSLWLSCPACLRPTVHVGRRFPSSSNEGLVLNRCSSFYWMGRLFNFTLQQLGENTV